MKTNFVDILASSVLATSFMIAVNPSASAFTLNNNGSVTFDNTMIGESFDVEFDGNSETQNITNMSSLATFTWLGFEAGTGNALFDISLENTSNNGLTSRTSVLGFDVDIELVSAVSSGDFNITVLDSALPNQFGSIGVCFKDGGGINNCQGGGSGGVTTGDPAINFSLALDWDNLVNQFTLSNFGVRYQSINGTGILTDGSTVSFNGGSGTGRGTPNDEPEEPENPTSVPEPGVVLGLAFLVGTMTLSRRLQTI